MDMQQTKMGEILGILKNLLMNHWLESIDFLYDVSFGHGDSSLHKWPHPTSLGHPDSPGDRFI